MESNGNVSFFAADGNGGGFVAAMPFGDGGTGEGRAGTGGGIDAVGFRAGSEDGAAEAVGTGGGIAAGAAAVDAGFGATGMGLGVIRSDEPLTIASGSGSRLGDSGLVSGFGSSEPAGMVSGAGGIVDVLEAAAASVRIVSRGEGKAALPSTFPAFASGAPTACAGAGRGTFAPRRGSGRGT